VALNPPDEPPFVALEDTPTVNGLGTLVNGVPQGVLLTDNPNANNPANNNPSKGGGRDQPVPTRPQPGIPRLQQQ
jgi:hypothetical protein